MKPATRVTIHDDAGMKFFGEGPYRLLRAVEALGSMRAAAASMQMAYSKAVKLLHQAEEALGFPLTERAIGGRDGGGSQLTGAALDFLFKYELWRDSCAEQNAHRYEQIFSERRSGKIALAIMASGEGKRFSGNKLMADFGGKPLIDRILDASEAVFYKRIVVTRHEEIAAHCRSRQVHVVRHDLPHRSDTIRLALASAGFDADACIFCPADQPLLRRESLEALVSAFERSPASILRLGCGDACGAPVLFPAWCFPELTNLHAAEGGRVLLEKYSRHVKTVLAASPLELRDIDTAEDLAALSAFI